MDWNCARLASLAICFAVLAGQTAHAETITFKAGCEEGDKLTIAAVGDLLFHKKLQRQALAPKGRYKDFWQPVAHVLSGADLTYGNLEGPAAPGLAAGGRKVKDPGRRLDDRVYGYTLKALTFNYHPSVIDDLKDAGFDVVSTANNHSLDRGALGVDRTIDALRTKGLPFTGTRKQGSLRTGWHVRTRTNGFTVAWLACTFSNNGFPDRKAQVLHCHKQTDQVLDEISQLSREEGVDAVIVTPHWGWENHLKHHARQRKLASLMMEAGATAVLGAHPHVVQPWSKYVTKSGRESLVVYSMGNFISNQRKLMQRAGGIVLLELTKTLAGARLSAAAYVPTWVDIRHVHRVVAGTSKRASRRALAKLRKVWPAGNEVPAQWPPTFVRKCSSDGET